MQRKNKRRALYVKARNIIRNNMQEGHRPITLTVANAPIFIHGFNVFQQAQQDLRVRRENYRRMINSTMAQAEVMD